MGQPCHAWFWSLFSLLNVRPVWPSGVGVALFHALPHALRPVPRATLGMSLVLGMAAWVRTGEMTLDEGPGPPPAGRGGDRRAGEVCAGPAELSGADLKDCVSNHSLSSNASLPSVQSCRRLRERRVASWAVSFERLLQDPLGVRYFSVSRGGPHPLARCVGSNPRAGGCEGITVQALSNRCAGVCSHSG